jgi:flagellar M-ring protein FliF
MGALNDLVGRVGSDKRVLIAVVGVALTLAVFGVARWAGAPTWVPAASGVDLELSGQLADRLTEAGIEHRLENGGSTILVSEDDLARARVALARDGLATGSRPGLELFDQQTWGWNDFTQRVNYRRALEGELERTIGRIGGVERASVHIAIGERSAFRRAEARAATASVVLAMRGGTPPSPEVVRGIAQLVSSSVDGLSADQVSVHDVTGRLWSEPGDGSVAALSARQLRMQQEVETYLERKAEAIVADVVGAGNARVRVAAALNFDRIERTTQSVDPTKQALASEQKAEIIPGADGGAASTNIANNYENSRSTEVFSSAVGNIDRLTVAVVVNETRLGPDGAPVTVARSPQELQRLESLVRGAIGLDTTRGDGITVVSAPFEGAGAVEPEEAPAGFVTLVERYQRPALNLVGLAAVLLIALFTLNALRTPAAAAARTPAALAAGAAGVATLAAGTPTPAPTTVPALGAGTPEAAMSAPSPAPALRPVPQIAFPQADTQVRDRVVQTVEKDPDAAARLVKSWIKEG